MTEHTADPVELFAGLLDRLDRPYSAPAALEALLALDARTARRVAGQLLAAAPEADALLRRMPETVRALSVGSTHAVERCRGELRGPVLWSETISARSATAGDPWLFVCATTSRGYDTEPNRVLVAALTTLRDAGLDASRGSDGRTAASRQARHRANAAERFLEHPTLSGVARARPDGRSIRQARAGRRRVRYQAAVDLLRRAGDLLSADLLAAHTHALATAGADLLLRILTADEAMAQRARRPPLRLRSQLDHLSAGPIRYRCGEEAPLVLVGERPLDAEATDDDITAALTATNLNVV